MPKALACSHLTNCLLGSATGTSSTASSPSLAPGEMPSFGASTAESSLPSTPTGRQSAESVDKDYFHGKVPYAMSSTRSLPASRNISFNSRVQFYDVWSSSEYDRRGEIATCNRLTPMLAQQIKEELNTFKMVSMAFSATFGDPN
jgi:hypothetical protein